MSKTVKNLLLVFTLVCAIALVVFSVELILLNSGAVTGEEGGPTSPATSPGGDSDSASKPEATSSAQNSPPAGTASSPGSTEPSVPPPPAPTGKRYVLPMLDDSKLILYADEELFEHSKMQDADRFIYMDESSALLEIGFNWIPPEGVKALAEVFLDGYLDGGESNVGGEGPIKRSKLSGVFVSGLKGTETYEAWLHRSEIAGMEDLAVYFVINYKNTGQRDALYKLLDSLDIIEE